MNHVPGRQGKSYCKCLQVTTQVSHISWLVVQTAVSKRSDQAIGLPLTGPIAEQMHDPTQSDRAVRRNNIEVLSYANEGKGGTRGTDGRPIVPHVGAYR